VFCGLGFGVAVARCECEAVRVRSSRCGLGTGSLGIRSAGHESRGKRQDPRAKCHVPPIHSHWHPLATRSPWELEVPGSWELGAGCWLPPCTAHRAPGHTPHASPPPAVAGIRPGAGAGSAIGERGRGVLRRPGGQGPYAAVASGSAGLWRCQLVAYAIWHMAYGI
jgi:hypothetical protein